MKKDIENELKKHYQNVPPMPNPDGVNQTVIRAREAIHPSEEEALSFWRFLFSQFGFIRKKVWIAQLFIILACGLALFYLPEEAKTIAIISAAAPLIVLTNVFELSRSYTHGMVEIELSTRYSLKQLMIARLSVLGMVDIFCLTILLVISGVQLSIETYAIILYAFVPFLITCFACLLVLNHIKRKECNYYCAAVGFSISLAIGIGTVQYPQIYELAAIWVWLILFILSLAGLVFEINRMLKNCGQKLNTIQLDSI